MPMSDALFFLSRFPAKQFEFWKHIHCQSIPYNHSCFSNVRKVLLEIAKIFFSKSHEVNTNEWREIIVKLNGTLANINWLLVIWMQSSRMHNFIHIFSWHTLFRYGLALFLVRFTYIKTLFDLSFSFLLFHILTKFVGINVVVLSQALMPALETCRETLLVQHNFLSESRSGVVTILQTRNLSWVPVQDEFHLWLIVHGCQFKLWSYLIASTSRTIMKFRSKESIL